MATRKILIARPPQASGASSGPLPESPAPTKPGDARRLPSATRGGRPRTGSIAASQSQQHQRDANVRTKFVIRKLPPLYTEAEFKTVTAEYINPQTVEWSYYVQGKMHRSKSTPMTFSRAYAKFKNVESLIAFNKAFGGKVVKDARGNESAMQIEFAPYEKVPRTKVKIDARHGTMENDPEYLAFQESLSLPRLPAAPPVPGGSTDSGAGHNGTTPLIEYLRTLKSSKKSSGGSASRSGKKEKEKEKKEKKKREKSKKSKGSENGVEKNKPDVATDAVAKQSHSPSGSAESSSAALAKDETSNTVKEKRRRSRGGRDKKKKELQPHSQALSPDQQSAATPKPRALTSLPLATGLPSTSVNATSSRTPVPAPLLPPTPTATLPQVTARVPSQQGLKSSAGNPKPSRQASEVPAAGDAKSQSRHRRGAGGRGGKGEAKSSSSTLSINATTSASAEVGSASTSSAVDSSGGRGRSSHRGRRHNGGNRGSNDSSRGTGSGGPPTAT